MSKKISIIALSILMFFTLMTANKEINIVNAEDSCPITFPDALSTEVIRTIEYVYEDGSTAKPTVTQKAEFDKEVTFDNVNGKIVGWGNFTPESKTLPQVTSPDIVGYTPDRQVVNELVARGNGKNSYREVVTYTPDVQKMKVIFKFGDNELRIINEDGRTDEAFKYNPANDIADFERLGYLIASNEYPSNGKYDNVADVDDNISQVYYITLKLRVDQTNEEKEVKRIIEYREGDVDGQELADRVEQTQIFVRTVKSSSEGVVYGEWSPASFEFEAVNSPEITDLTPSREVVDAITVTGDSKNIREVVIYVENPDQFANIKIVNENDGNVLESIDQSGKSGEPIGYNVTPKLDELIKQGYEVVDNPYSPDIVYDDDTDVDQLFVITVKPRINTCKVDEPCEPCRNGNCDPTPDEVDKKYLSITLLRTVDYKYAEDGSEAAPQAKQSMTFTRIAKVNAVTGEYWFEDLAPAQSDFNEVVSPVIEGYTADKLAVEAMNILSSVPLGLIPQDEPYLINNELVEYSKVPQRGVIKFQDETGKEIATEISFTGGSLEDFPETAKENKDTTILELIKIGYELVSDTFEDEPNKKFDSDPNVDQKYVVTLKEIEVIIPPDDPKSPGDPACEAPCEVKYIPGFTYDDLNKEFVRTIHHIDKNGTKLLDDATQNAAERYTYKFNLVTKEVTLIDTKVENYPEYKTPDIEKMSKDKDVVPADERLENLEEDVLYTKITYKVTFIDGLTGEELKVEEVEPGDDATAPDIPVHENYKAGEWDKDFTNVQGDLIVTIPYTPVEKPVCVVKFVDGLTGKIIDTQQIECGTGAKDPGKPEHENYTTGDWDKPFDKVEEPELIVTVNYERKKCRVMFIDALIEKEDVCKIFGDKYTGGGLIADVEYYCGDPVTPPTPTKHDGYEFDGWVKADCSMIIYARYKKITVKPMVPTGSGSILETLFSIFR